MTSTAAKPITSAYGSGRLAPGDDRVFRPGGMALTERAIAISGLQRGATILDLGCGRGHTAYALGRAGFHAIGLDRDLGLGTEQHSAPSWRIVARAEAIPLPEASVDGVLAECSLSLVDDQSCVLAESARVLRDGGRLMISDLYARQPEAIGQVRAIRGSCISGTIVRTELETQLAQNGFKVDVWEDRSRDLRELVARFIMENGSLDGLWSCASGPSSRSIECAMRASRAGYFLLVASRMVRSRTERWMTS